MKQLALDLLQVTEAAALAAVPWIGRGNKLGADDAATTAMRKLLNAMPIDGCVVIGEGEMDEAPMLYIGERVGMGQGPLLDIAVDPLEGTNLVAGGWDNSCAVIAVAPRGALLHAPDMYMEKIAVGRRAAGAIDLNASILDNMKRTADALNKRISELTVIIQHRDRHKSVIEDIQKTGARVRLFSEGDVTCAIAAALDKTGVDLFYGVGGAPEGVLSAVALKCMGGEMQARLLPADRREHERCVRMGLSDPGRVLRMEELVSSDDCIFAATGVTSGMLLEGVKLGRGIEATTHSLLTCGDMESVHFIRSVRAATG
ncbi:class II fructose-bisphosphatase [Paenibacillus sp. J2TS4]|uniref:class II fructose-bisphosphatase n=1 Tax=Paenibacillus sp. J2TS4 TaxID=2807194 RepID=UPI001B2B9F15|nr:class II fructose-bisphosphatase [Paenibacillus sp. J2TS4]GIP33236.1 fructose-1,6-bisphosphatase [Paenibacillus sp. J2TS4]